ncbi:hypothetical protein V6N11_011775 [Hibiscus sabdariffa]|uniref:Uncharacterized protein n=1 Tax=Hibiscus sabdariffa TaxID=183260 RepID=A0ABR2S9A0_9ROSI
MNDRPLRPGHTLERSKAAVLRNCCIRKNKKGNVVYIERNNQTWKRLGKNLAHVLRTGNSVVNLLAKRATHSDFEMHIVSDPDATLRQLLQSDMDAHAGRVD